MTADDLPVWTAEAQARLTQVPEGVMRDLTRQRVEETARRLGRTTVTLELLEEKYRQWLAGSDNASSVMVWAPEAQGRIDRIPTFVRGMVVKAIESYAEKRGIQEVTSELVDEAKSFWGQTEKFHEP